MSCMDAKWRTWIIAFAVAPFTADAGQKSGDTDDKSGDRNAAHQEQTVSPRAAEQGRRAEKTKPTSDTRPVKDSNREPSLADTVRQSASNGAAWLLSFQRADGLFTYGWLPSLNRQLPGDNYLRQIGATAALARSAGVLRDVEMTLAARHAILVLLESYTEIDAKDPALRRPILPAADANPVGFAGLLLTAIGELPAPTEDLVAQADQLARYLVSRQRPDGSFNVSLSTDEDAEDTPEAINYYPGEALYGLMKSHNLRPADWKLGAVVKSYSFYERHFKNDPSAAFVPWQTCAFAEAFLITKDDRFAKFVFEMNDWLLQLQYVDPKTVEAAWLGGFGSHRYGQTLWTAPGATTGSYLESLVDAVRVAQAANDLQRATRYQSAVDRAIRFLMTTQFAAASSSHFEPWFARKMDGAFYASVEDGTVRIDFSQHAVSGMMQYLRFLVPQSVERKSRMTQSEGIKAN